LTKEEAAAAAAKEKAEQEALPYKWVQTIGDVDITFTVPGNIKGRDLVVDIKRQKLSAGLKGQEPIISVRLSVSRFPGRAATNSQLTVRAG
jgi:hypothetical protein